MVADFEPELLLHIFQFFPSKSQLAAKAVIRKGNLGWLHGSVCYGPGMGFGNGSASACDELGPSYGVCIKQPNGQITRRDRCIKIKTTTPADLYLMGMPVSEYTTFIGSSPDTFISDGEGRCG